MRKKRILHLMCNVNKKFEDITVDLVLNHKILRKYHTHIFINTCKFSNPQNLENLVTFSCKTRWELYFKTIYEILRADLIIFHGLFYSFYILIGNFLFLLLKKGVWMIWGGDLYSYNIERTSIKFILKKKLLKNLYAIGTIAHGDYLYAKKAFQINAKEINVGYPSPINFKLFQISNPTKSETVFLLGNSSNRSNDHIEILDILKEKIASRNVLVKCPLSYGDRENLLIVSNYGKELLKDKFLSIERFMNPLEYANFLSSIDIAFMNHKYQQGLSTTIALLYAGKKVYLRKGISTFYWLKRLGIKTFDIRELKNESFSDIIKFDPKIGIKNRSIMENFYSDKNISRIWFNLFNN